MAYASVNSLEELKENKDYLKYWKKKQKIKEKYPKDLWIRPTGSKNALNKNYNNHHLWKEYIKEIGDLLLEPKGDYQKFSWEVLISDSDKVIMEQKARGSQREGSKY
jgi:hypothetical protein